jgi:hypothetical protein
MPVLAASGLLIAAVIGLPLQAAAPPPKNIAQLRHEVAVLKAKVRKLTGRNKNLAASNALAQKREDALDRHILAIDSCPITRPNGSIPPSVSGSGWHGNGSLWVEFPFTTERRRAPTRCGRFARDEVSMVARCFRNPWYRGKETRRSRTATHSRGP